jgi:hypothetical protein
MRRRTTHSSDPEAFDAEMARQRRDVARLGRAGARLAAAIREELELANAPLRPAEKVRHLEQAKWALGEFEEACTAPSAGFSVTGVAEARAQIAALEAVFRAFGWCRQAGRR